MTGSSSSLLILFIVIRSIQTQVCDFRSECGVVGGKTELFCAVTEETPARDNTIWSGPQGDLILGGISKTSNVDLRMTSYGFYLIILNTTESNVGSYTCGYRFSSSPPCTLTKENLEALTCEEKVVDRRIVITITYRPYINLPYIQVTDKDENDITGSFNTGEDDVFLEKVLWTSADLMGGTYNYIVDGACSLLTDCSGTVVIPEAPTTTPSMNAPITVKLEDGCIKYNADTSITCILPSGKSVDANFIFWTFNSAHIVSNGFVTGNITKYDTASTGTTFSLIIHNLAISDIGSYTCEYLDDLVLDFNLMKKDIEDITCNAAGDTKAIIISIEYNNKAVQNPVAEVDAKTVSCVDVSTSAEEPTAGTCTFHNLATGTYSYTVNNYGDCNLMCTGQVTVTEAVTTAPSTNAPRTVNGHEQMAGDITLLISLLLMFNVL